MNQDAPESFERKLSVAPGHDETEVKPSDWESAGSMKRINASLPHESSTIRIIRALVVKDARTRRTLSGLLRNMQRIPSLSGNMHC
jgi:hypothetical protein